MPLKMNAIEISPAFSNILHPSLDLLWGAEIFSLPRFRGVGRSPNQRTAKAHRSLKRKSLAPRTLDLVKFCFFPGYQTEST